MLKFLKVSIITLPITLFAIGCATVAEQPHRHGATAGEVPAEHEQIARVRPATGSRIPVRVTEDGRQIPHASAPVVSYDREAIRSTGHRDLDTALFLIGPATGW